MQQMPQGMPQMPQGAPAGLGATPEAAAMPAPAEAMMGAPSAQPMPGMAEGGMVPPYASGGGLSDLPVPDGMFDEPSNGGFNDGYRGGGLVAFREGTDEEGVQSDEIVVNAPRKDPILMREQIDDLYTPERKYGTKLNEFYEGVLDPEKQKKRRQEDMWTALGQIGARMAQTPGSLLQAASAGVSEALPGITAAAKERRAEERDAVKTLAQNEGLNNKEALELAKLTMEGTGKYGEFDVKRLDREQQERLEILKDKRERWQTLQQVGAQRYSADRSAEAQVAFADRQLLQLQRQVAGAAVAQLPELRAALNNPIGLANNAYKLTLQKFGGNSQQAAAAYAALQKAEDAYVQTAVQRATGGMGGGGNSGSFEGFSAEPAR
jgi:hypothetical protein